MAAFPAIEPTGRTYDLGTFAMSAASSLSGAGVRFNHSAVNLGHTIKLTFQGLIESDAALIRRHYQGQDGTNRSFPLPDVIWLAHTNTADLTPTTNRWIYASAPPEPAQNGAFYDMTVSLRNVGDEPADAGE